MLKRRKLRRTLGALLVIGGGVLMWLAPDTAFVFFSVPGLILMVAGVALEIVGIALERNADSKSSERSADG
jgi:uncharacterized membrane protein HdeD (DUF308 family)